MEVPAFDKLLPFIGFILIGFGLGMTFYGGRLLFLIVAGIFGLIVTGIIFAIA